MEVNTPPLNDNCYENLINLVKELGLESSIQFSGYVPDELLPDYLAKSDAFVLPYNEWGDVIASSGALSVVAPYLKPIIATDVPAFLHLKKLGAALIVKRGDPDGLASAIMKVLTDVRTRNSLVTKLNKWLPESSWSIVARKTATVVQGNSIIFDKILQSEKICKEVIKMTNSSKIKCDEQNSKLPAFAI